MIMSSQQSELKLDKDFTILWNIWKVRNDLLFNRRKWSAMQVLHANKAMLNASLMEEEEKKSSPEDTNSNLLPSTNVHIEPTGFLAYVGAAYNPTVTTDEASLGFFLRNELSGCNIHSSSNCRCSICFAGESIGQLLAATIVKAEAAEAKDLLKHPGHWRIRPVLAEFFNLTSCLNHPG